MPGKTGGKLSGGQLVEYFFGQPHDLPRVCFFLTKAPANRVNASQTVVGDVGDRRA